MSTLRKSNPDLLKSVARRLCWKDNKDPELFWKDYLPQAKEAMLEVAEWIDDHIGGTTGMKIRAMISIERKKDE